MNETGNPCAECPFRRDKPGVLTRKKAAFIARLLGKANRTGEGLGFACHMQAAQQENGDFSEFNNPECAGKNVILSHLSGNEPPRSVVCGTLQEFVDQHGASHADEQTALRCKRERQFKNARRAVERTAPGGTSE